MKLLFVYPDNPFPPNKGYRLQSYHHLLYLGSRHEIDLATFGCWDTAEPVKMGGVERFVRRIDLTPLPKIKSLSQITAAFWTGEPFQAAYYRSSHMASLVEQRLAATDYDVVVFTMIRMAQYRPAWYRGPTVLNLVDPVVLGYERSIAWRPFYLRPLVRAEVARLRRYEAELVPRFDRALLINPADVADYASIVPGARLDWVPHGVDTEYFSPMPLGRREGLIVISGNMYYPPNVDGVLFFCREILPLIRRQEPNAQVCLVGARPAAAVRALAESGVVEVTGSVPDLRPYLAQALVSVCPVRLKLGTQTKILEAMAMGTPVVTTSAGNHGIGGMPGEDLLVADDAPGLAAAVVALLRRQKWELLSARGRALVTGRFTWAASASRMENILMNVAGSESGITKGRVG